ncbi:thiamine pyrophosphate-binding protein [Roseospira marina]|uniref:Thiamine pyrophosphate-binding protein n=1 Tax=Roseospira marina TaxID=140057 RepID=A0A5M6IG88_9PROT|nr:thiamine pyrophosphate-binding protein [Roseospira marina]KAA5606779.1 thiamine pyrophosphate-binding protein [Roseospira marina]MBB4313799.1 acetolactate synthase-1/2/3 large subunit [Roseospira marina]MBB5086961.1 acetolactate synthase-1/2/3 large subunit [Roseospira marina]
MERITATGGEWVVGCLNRLGVRRVYGVPGESFLPVLDALHDSAIRFVGCRHESGATMAAEAEAKLTGRPGVAFVTRGPGATNAMAGLHVAQQDSTPLVLFVGQIARGTRHREAFQEVDVARLFGDVAKWAADITRADRVPEMISRAFHVATGGRPGPVVLGLPEDMLRDDATNITLPKGFAPTELHPGHQDMIRLAALVDGAERPLAIVGGSCWDETAVTAFTRFAEVRGLPVACAFRRQMLFDHAHPYYAGDLGLGANPALLKRVRDADVILAVGSRLGDVPTQGYTLLDIPRPRQTLIHVHADPEELGRVYRSSLGIAATPRAFCAALGALPPPLRRRDDGVVRAAHHAYRMWSTPPETGPGAVHMGPIMTHLQEVLPDTTIITNGAGNFATWVHRFHRFRRYGTQAAPTSGSMGYAMPAAVGAQLACPDRPVVCVTGDGDIQMTLPELGTMAQNRLPILILVVNNGMYGTIRMHQERAYPGRISATDLTNPDFAMLARSYGAFGETVTETAAFAPAFARACDHVEQQKGPALLDIHLDPEAITPTRTLSQIRAGG